MARRVEEMPSRSRPATESLREGVIASSPILVGQDRARDTRGLLGCCTVRKQKTFVFLSQVYVPDPAAVGQHLADVAEELARAGQRVIVLTADRGYDDRR
jgi:hypothetical protein